MKILLDVSSVTLPMSGIGRYALELAQHLPAARGVSSVLYLRGNQVQDTFEPSGDASPRPPGRLRQWIKPLLPYKFLLAPYRRYKARALAARLGKYDDHIYYSPNFSVPPLRSPSVVTLHDLSVFHFPEFHPGDRVNYLKDQIEHSVKKASHLITDSEFVRGELMALFQLSAERVTAIPLGVDESFRPQGEGQMSATMERYGLRPGGYLLSVGTIEPRKNLAGLLQAYLQLAPSLRKRYPLVVAGAYGWNCDDLMAEIERLRRSGELIYLDYVPEPDLPALYAGAAVFCYFSFYEGFGLPVLEAMSSGVPVVCAQTSALPELCADVALQADPRDVDAMSAVLQRALEDSDWREQAIVQGWLRSGDFTWQNTCSRLVEVFRGLPA